MTKIHPLVLCGGMGSRLWPMSRQHQPKQFQPTNGPGTLTYFQTTVQRHRGPIYEDPIVVTNLRHADLASQQLAEEFAEWLRQPDLARVEALVFRAAARRRLEQRQAALQDVSAALALDPDNPEALLERDGLA